MVTGKANTEDNVLKNAPHTRRLLPPPTGRIRTRAKRAFPLPWVREQFWPAVGRIDNRTAIGTCSAVARRLNR